MISSVMSARVLVVEGNLLLFSVLTSPVFSTTASSAGLTSTPVPDGSFTSLWLKKAPTALARFTSAGIRDCDPQFHGNTVRGKGNREIKHWLTGKRASLSLSCFLSYQYNQVHNTIQYILYIYISFVAAKHHKPQFFTKTPRTSQALTTLQLFCGTFIFSKRRFKKQKKRLIFVAFFIIIIFVCEI